MRWTTWTVAAETATAVVAAAVLLALGPVRHDSPAQAVTTVLVAAVLFAAAVVVARGAPGHVEGPLLGAAGVVLIGAMLTPDLTGTPIEMGWMLLYLPLALVLVVVPAGRAANRRWRVVGWALTAVVAGCLGLGVLRWTVPGWATLGTVVEALLPVFLVLLLTCAAAPIVRYRRADELTRLRLRWVLVAGLSVPATLMLCWASYLVLGSPDLVVVGLILMYTALPAGVAVAVTRPTLADVDRAAVATVSATVLAAVVLLVLSAASAAVGTALVSWSPPVAVGTTSALTVLAVLAFPPTRTRVDRLLYPERARAVQALHTLSRAVDAGTAAPEEVEAVLRGALRDPGLRVAVGRAGALVGLQDGPVRPGPTTAVLHTRGEEIGAIVPSAARVARVASSIAEAAAPLVDAVRLRAELRVSKAEVEASRERLLRVGYEERRRLERDLHDGAQQRLVALGMQLRVLQRTAAPDPQLESALDGAVAQLGTAVAELRRIAHGMRPSALEDGLGPALAELTRLAPGTIELSGHPGELPDAVATTAFFVAHEGVANALRHAGPATVRVHTAVADGRLHVAVVDDGCGGAALRPHGGLAGLADRVAALGGTLRVDSVPGAGTRVQAVLPCGW